MITTIIKRNGQEVEFNLDKIFNAIEKANKAVDQELMDQKAIAGVANQVVEEISASNAPPTVEGVQDLVEKHLILGNYPKTAKAYILYRADHSKARQTESALVDIFNQLTLHSAKESDLHRENANIDADTAMGTMLKFGTESTKFYNLKYILPKHIAAAHESGDIHIHDLDFLNLTTTCCQIDLIKLFNGGFSTGHGYQREPQTIRSCAALACIAIQSNQNDQFGGQSLNNFDYAMAIGVKRSFRRNYFDALGEFLKIRYLIPEQTVIDLLALMKDKTQGQPEIASKTAYKDVIIKVVAEFKGKTLVLIGDVIDAHRYAYDRALEVTERETLKSMIALIHNLNTMASRAGAQVPFSSINYGTDTSPEGRMVIKNILLATEAGLGNGETPIFPVQIFKVKEGVNYFEDDPNYDLFKQAMRTSAKRLFPNFSFLDAPFNLQYYEEGNYDSHVCYMGCRTRVIGNAYDTTREVTGGRGNLSFTSLNLPRIALESEGDLDRFYAIMDQRMDLIIEQLLHRFKIQANKQAKNFPFLMGEGVWLGSENLKPDDKIGEVLKHGTLSMGFIGLAETLTVLTGNHHGESNDSQRLGLEIIGKMRAKMDCASKQYLMNFTLLATPAEGLSGRFVRLDKKRFGEITGVTDKEYYTNSFHIPVSYPISAYKKIQTEAPYHSLTNAGHITYVELEGDIYANIAAYETIIHCMKDSGLGFGAINHQLDFDPVCKYQGIIGNECPKCHRTEADGLPKFQRIRRISGYLVGTLDRWNDAKRAEERDRVKHGQTAKN